MISEQWAIFLVVFQFIVGFYVGYCLNGIRHEKMARKASAAVKMQHH